MNLKNMDLAKVVALSCVCVLFIAVVEGKSNKFYTIPSYSCGIVKEIDGAVVQSSRATQTQYSHSACILKFMSSDNFITSKKIRVSVSQLQLACTTTLKLFDRSGTAGTPMATFTCRDNVSSVIYMTTQKYLSVRLENNGIGTSNFKLVLTTVKSSSYCDEYRCNNGYCIDKDLRCDGIDHCFDGSDETSRAYCRGTGRRPRYVFNTGSMLGVIISALVLLTIVSVFLFICRRRRMMSSRHRGAPVTMTYQSPAPPPGSYPAMQAAAPTAGYAPVTNGDPATVGYPPQYPPPQYPPLQGYAPPPGYPPQNPETYNYATPPPAYYQATGPQYPPQEQK